MLQRTFVAVTALWLGIGAFVSAQDRATVQMRDGSKFEGRIEELTAKGELFVRVSQDDQRRVAIGSVALIDKVGGANGLPDTEVREAVGQRHVLVMTNGQSMQGQLIVIRGGEGSANGDQPRTYVFRTGDGLETSLRPDQVGRIYLGNYPFAATNAGTPAAAAAATTADLAQGVPGGVRVAANAGWVSTGLRVRKGEFISFSTTGQVQLSSNANDRATSAGTNRTAPGSPLPTVNAGALIGRIGTGQAFGIGNQSSVPMPFDGILYLAVNDDEHSDNAGEFVVAIARQRR